MDPLTLSILGLVTILGAGAYVVSVIILTIKKITSIFSRIVNRIGITRGDIGFVTEAINSGQHTHIQGVFNQNTGKIRAQVPIKANDVDTELKNALRKSPVVLFD